MASPLRSPAIRRALSAASSGGLQGASFRRAPSAANPVFEGEGGATAPRYLALTTVPRRHLCGPPPPGGATPNPTPYLIDRLLREVQEVEQLVQQNVNEFLELYEEMRTGDHGYLERFLSKRGIPRCQFRDDFVWGCKLATIFAASAVAPHLLPVL